MGFRGFLEQRYTPKAVASRLSRLNWVSRIVGLDPDIIVLDPQNMFNAREVIYNQARDRKAAGNYYNALRLYYEFRNGHPFIRK
jgi:hypothetical protein